MIEKKFALAAAKKPPVERWRELTSQEREITILTAGFRSAQYIIRTAAVGNEEMLGWRYNSIKTRLGANTRSGIISVIVNSKLGDDELNMLTDADPALLANLSPLQKKILECKASDYAPGEIAEELGIEKTEINEQGHQIISALGLKTVKEAVCLYIKGMALKHPAVKYSDDVAVAAETTPELSS